VPYDESRSCIDEFWKLDCAKSGYEQPTSAFPVGGGGKRGREEESHETGQTGATPSPRYSSAAGATLSPTGVCGRGGGKGTSLHLMVVWFDLLVVGEESLLDGACPPFLPLLRPLTPQYRCRATRASSSASCVSRPPYRRIRSSSFPPLHVPFSTDPGM
jgi:hypothetical protein